MRELKWRPRAHLDRESIAIYLGVECGDPQAALNAMRKIDRAIERIREVPDIGGFTRSPGKEGREYRTVIASPYTIYYRFTKDELAIYRILHQRQDIDAYTLLNV
ncbi:MAG: type II toxin-antitoxin system RelE/ParE family toxin [Coriobacteriia bacterium]|nr:type II toxin-antitoxin system RelE/ParE family toxin [Coriobacteriia bacterium]